MKMPVAVGHAAAYNPIFVDRLVGPAENHSVVHFLTGNCQSVRKNLPEASKN